MKKIIQLILIINIVLGISIEKLSAATVTWDGGASTSTWSDAANWDSDAVPTAADDVIIDGETVILTANTQVQRVYLGGSAQLTVNSGVTLTITGFAGNDEGLEVQGSATCINNGTIAISNIVGGSGADGLYNKGTTTNNGAITIDGIGQHGLYVVAGTFTNAAGGTITVTNTGQVNSDGDCIYVDDANSGTLFGTLNNEGTITVTLTTGDDGIYVNDNTTFNNMAMVTISSTGGDNGMRVDEGSVFNNNAGGTLTINSTPNDQLFLDNDGAFNNTGTVNLNNGSDVGLYVTDQGVFTNNEAGNVNITAASNYSIQVDAKGSTAEVVNNGTITINGGSNDGVRLQQVGKFTNNATLNITNAGDEGIQIDDGATPVSTFNNSGTVTITTPTDHGMELFGTFNNLAGGTYKALDCPDDGIRMRNTGVFNNDGAIVINGSGSEDIETDADVGATFSNTANGTIVPGASPGLMEIKDDFDLGTATVIFEITGTTAITAYDQIQNFSAGNTMTISNATMHLDWGAYTPTVGDKFKVIDGSGTVSGPFAAVTTSNSSIVTSVDYLGDTNTEVEIEVTAILCALPTGLAISNITETTADLSWSTVDDASAYNWKVVAAGAGSGGTAVASGTTAGTTASATGLTGNTSYDLHVQADCGGGDLSAFSTAANFMTTAIVQIGEGTSSSSTRGPFQRADTNSTTVYSRWIQIYTESELAAAGITNGASISALQWDLASSNIIIGNGDATLKIYIKNSSATAAVSDTWVNHIAGSSLAVDNSYNTSNNFPGAEGWMPFSFTTPFTYTGGTLEIAVDWDCSQVSTPAFSGNGALKWRWESTAPNDLVVKKTASSSAPSTITDLKNERANIQIVYIPPPPPDCVAPSNLAAANLTPTSADLSWDEVSGATEYNWVIVAAGAGADGTAVASGSTAGTMVSATGLTSNTSYDLHVQTDCGGGDLSDFSTAYNFITACPIPTNLASTNLTTTTVDLSWDAVGEASMYNWKVVAAGEGAAGTAVASGITANTTVSATGLTSNTSYDLHVQTDCGGDNLSDFSTAYNFMTPVSMCPVPTNVASATITETTANLSWDAVSGATAYTWTVVAAGDCLGGEVITSGTTASTTASATGLVGNTSYNLQVQADCGGGDLSDLSAIHAFTTMGVSTPMLLSADGPGGTYDLMIAALAPGTTPASGPVEPPDCNHMDFMATPTGDAGEHIDEVFDADLGQNAFRFHLHVTPDNDRCINFDRQRNEIKTYNNSPDNLLGVLGETVEYKWKFKLPVGFQSSSKFTHIHQLKSVGASNNEDDMPQITFTTRKGTNGNPDQLELRYAEDLTQITWAQTDLTPFKGAWVEATETVTYGDWGDGVYSLEIKKLSDCSTLLSYTNNSTRMWKTDATFVRPKWGIYRSLENAADLRDEEVLFADFSIVELSATAACAGPTTYLNATNVSFFTADLSWGGVAGATAYTWKVVAAGAGSGGTAIATGTTINTTVSVTGLTDNTAYDLYVDADCGGGNTTGYSAAYNFMTEEDTGELTTDPLGTEASSSSSRGPIHQAGTGASTRYSRFFHVVTQSELAAVGLTANSSITKLQWYLTTSDVITGAGDAPLKIYIKNSSATVATEGSWATFTTGATLALDRVFNETNNFPGTAGWMPLTLDTPFDYTGGALEIAVEFNWASVAFTNNGSAKWRYSNYPDNVMVRALATGADGDYKDNLTLSSTGKQRANMQIVYIPAPVSCPAPENLNASNRTTSSADVSWDAVDGASAYSWKVVTAGAGSEATAVASGTTGGTSASVTGLANLTAYDLHVQADCGGGDLSTFSPAYTFVTLSSIPSSSLTIGTGTDVNSSIGPIHQGGASANTRYSRFNQVYTQAELAAAGLITGSKITELQWYLASTDIITLGEAPFTVYIKNSTVTEATPNSWFDLTLGLTPVVEQVFNTTNNFPGEEGWVPFTFNTPFIYTGGALEVLVEWNWASAAFTNDGAVNWRYSTTPGNMVVRSLGSGSYPTSNLSYSTSTTSPPTFRANTQIIHTPPAEACPEMMQLDQANIPSETYKANTITSKGTVESGSTVVLAANTSVTLETGFHAKAGADFTAKIEECVTSSFQTEETQEELARFVPINTAQTDTKLDIKVYPNPISQQLNVELQAFEKGQARLFDGTGKTHITRIITGSTTLNTHNLPVGIYFLQVFDENTGQFFTRRIVKQ